MVRFFNRGGSSYSTNRSFESDRDHYYNRSHGDSRGPPEPRNPNMRNQFEFAKKLVNTLINPDTDDYHDRSHNDSMYSFKRPLPSSHDRPVRRSIESPRSYTGPAYHSSGDYDHMPHSAPPMRGGRGAYRSPMGRPAHSYRPSATAGPSSVSRIIGKSRTFYSSTRGTRAVRGVRGTMSRAASSYQRPVRPSAIVSKNVDRFKSRAVVKSEKPNSVDKTKNSNLVSLKCVHCRLHVITRQAFQQHLDSKQHTIAMQRVMIAFKNKLNSLRLTQRQKQERTEREYANTKGAEEGATKLESLESVYCSSCRLQYRLVPGSARHDDSDYHKQIYSLQNPVCRVCDDKCFESRLSYERHLATPDHIIACRKQEASKETAGKTPDTNSSTTAQKSVPTVVTIDDDGEEIEETEETEVDLMAKHEDMMVVDEVGGNEDPVVPPVADTAASLSSVVSSVVTPQSTITTTAAASRPSVSRVTTSASKKQPRSADSVVQQSECKRGKVASPVGSANTNARAEPKAKKDVKEVASRLKYDGKSCVGEKYMNKIEVYHCDLCDIYIKITSKIKQVILKHCQSRRHFDNYRLKLAAEDDEENMWEDTGSDFLLGDDE